jgi:hypothetical protein
MEENMINLNEHPDAILFGKQNDLFILDGEEFIVDETSIVKCGAFLSKNTSNRRLYLSLPTNKLNDLKYEDYCVHVRDLSVDRFVIFDRTELAECIRNKTYQGE